MNTNILKSKYTSKDGKPLIDQPEPSAQMFSNIGKSNFIYMAPYILKPCKTYLNNCVYSVVFHWNVKDSFIHMYAYAFDKDGNHMDGESRDSIFFVHHFIPYVGDYPCLDAKPRYPYDDFMHQLDIAEQFVVDFLSNYALSIDHKWLDQTVKTLSSIK